MTRQNITLTYLIAFFCSCNTKTLETEKTANYDSVVKSIKSHIVDIPNMHDYFMSYNETSYNQYKDTIFIHQVDSFMNRYADTTFSKMTTSEKYGLASLLADSLIKETVDKIAFKLKTKEEVGIFLKSQENWNDYYIEQQAFFKKVFVENQQAHGVRTFHSLTKNQWCFQTARQRLILLKNIDDQLH
ncbi:MAG: hypothetical protein KAZ71_04980 [Bacteroidia bacterium]|nr:hypothetical protein [Bacteroidia bacterium]